MSNEILSPHGDSHQLLKPKKRPLWRDIVVISVFFVFILAASAAFLYKDYKEAVSISFDPGAYQAVFLTNGQVYFGHIGEQNKDFIVVRDIYYLQLNNLQQQKENEESSKETELSLVKLGNELHAPEDRMEINKQQILFIEDLKGESKVVQAIQNYSK